MEIAKIDFETVRNLVETRYSKAKNVNTMKGEELSVQEKSEVILIMNVVLRVCEFRRIHPVDFLAERVPESENPQSMKALILACFRSKKSTIKTTNILRVFTEKKVRKKVVDHELEMLHESLMFEMKSEYRIGFGLLKAEFPELPAAK